MEKNILNEGKTKQILKYNDSTVGYKNLVKVTTKNILTANDAVKKEEVDVARDKTNQTCNVFKYLERNGIKTCFISQLDDYSFVSKRCKMMPYECVVRRRAFGSFLKRHERVVSGEKFTQPHIEFFHKMSVIPAYAKNDYGMMSPWPQLMEESKARDLYLKNGEWIVHIETDPIIHFNFIEWNRLGEDRHSKEGFKLDLYPAKKPIKLEDRLISIDSTFTVSELYKIESIMKNVFIFLEKAWSKFDIELVDLKIEFGYDYDNDELVVSDVIDNDSWRIWPKGDSENQLDKQSFRDGEKLESVKKKYSQVTEYTKQFLM
jgi:phosphoribosylaminoimidazole-succinocarboxamide synthase